MKYQRVIDLSHIEHKSLFLFGPRQVGKSSLLKTLFPEAIYYDLLKSDLFLRLSKSPHLLREELLAQDPKGPIIIDEIQKIPLLLDEVHYLIEEKQFKFILTGSSARKLKRGGANMLGGRALEKNMFSLTTNELGDYDFERIINFGSLPSIYQSKIPQAELNAYVGTYLKEEIAAEGLVRNLIPFAEFLDLAGQTNSEIINYSNMASDIGVSAKTIKEYYQILEDTLLGELLPVYTKTNKRKPIATPKFFLFDVGVANTLAGRTNIMPKTELFGKCFEHFIFTEIRSYLNYNSDQRKLTFWRTKTGQEVDFIIGNDIAIEVKGTSMVQPKHLKGLRQLSEEVELKHKIVVSLDDSPRLLEDNFLILPYKIFLEKLWHGEF